MRRSAGPRAGEGASPIWNTDSSPGSRITIARMRDRSPQAGRPSQSGRPRRLDLARRATYASGQPMLVLVLLAAAIVALIIWRLAARLRDVDRQVKELRLLRHEIEELRADLDRGLGVTRAHLAAVAADEPPERDVILRGAPWRDVEPAEALALYEKTPGLFVLDVRTPAEYASGHIPDAHLIPVDELEDRLRELPPKDSVMLVHCAVGGRRTSRWRCGGIGPAAPRGSAPRGSRTAASGRRCISGLDARADVACRPPQPRRPSWTSSRHPGSASSATASRSSWTATSIPPSPRSRRRRT